MKGFVSNGEYNSLRSNGYSRPLSVLKLKSDARTKYSKMGPKKLLDMLTPIGESHLSITTMFMHVREPCTCLGTDGGAVESNPAVPNEVLVKIAHLKQDGISMEDIVSRLRSRTVPPGHAYHTWRVLSGCISLVCSKHTCIIMCMLFFYR